MNGANVFTHGVEIGVARNETHNLQTATDELIQSLAQGDPETIQIFSALMPDGNLLYAIAVAPADRFGEYQPTFERIAASIQFTQR
jgi:hypothetical protein